MQYMDKLNEADRRAYNAATTAWARHSVLRWSLDKEELDKLFVLGDTPEVKEYELVLEDWAPLVELATGETTGMVRRVGGRPLTEIQRKLSRGLERAGLIVDEYFSLSSDAQYNHRLDSWPDNCYNVACYATEGGNEGHYVYVDVTTNNPGTGGRNTFGMFVVKTFLGMEHALRLSNELTRMFAKVY